jgi:hypothetical protein
MSTKAGQLGGPKALELLLLPSKKSRDWIVRKTVCTLGLPLLTGSPASPDEEGALLKMLGDVGERALVFFAQRCEELNRENNDEGASPCP